MISGLNFKKKFQSTEIEITGGHWSLSEHLGLMATQVWICSNSIYYMMYIGGLANIPLTGQLSGQISILISTSESIVLEKCQKWAGK